MRISKGSHPTVLFPFPTPLAMENVVSLDDKSISLLASLFAV